MEDGPKAPRTTSVALSPSALEDLDAINAILRAIGYRVKTSALVDAALAELREAMLQPGRAVELVRRRVPPHSVVFPP
ncbi:MAG: hypothetical protein ACREM8_00345 [Vulcanimicrobiaceae bacterium]